MTLSTRQPLGLAAAAAVLLIVAGCNKSATDIGGTSSSSTNSSSSSGTVAPPAGKTWVDVLEQTPDGGYRIGNPNAQVKLIEYASVWCPHCKEFHEKSMAALKANYIAKGTVSYERRDFVLTARIC